MPIMPGELGRAGYRTGFYGKWHIGFLQQEALPGNKGIEDARVFVRGSVNHKTSMSNGRGEATCSSAAGINGVMSSIRTDNDHSFIFDHTVTINHTDYASGPNAGYHALINPSMRPTPRCDTCTEGDNKWGNTLNSNFDDTQHLSSYIRDLAIARIKTHDLADTSAPLALFLMWSGPHLPHEPEGIVTAAQMEAAHCAQEQADGHLCSGDQYYTQRRFVRRQFKDSGYEWTDDETCMSPRADNFHSSYQAMMSEISLHIGKIKAELVARTDSNGVTMWDSTLMVMQSDNGGIPDYNYPMRGVRSS
jgi:arylsulfatase A-like enzyme